METVLLSSVLQARVWGVYWKKYRVEIVMQPMSPRFLQSLKAPIPAPMFIHVHRASGKVKQKIACRVVDVSVYDSRQSKFEFCITDVKGSAMVLRAPTKQVLQDWVSTLRFAIRAMIKPVQVKQSASNVLRLSNVLNNGSIRQTITRCAASSSVATKLRRNHSFCGAKSDMKVDALRPMVYSVEDCESFRSASSSSESIRPSEVFLGTSDNCVAEARVASVASSAEQLPPREALSSGVSVWFMDFIQEMNSDDPADEDGSSPSPARVSYKGFFGPEQRVWPQVSSSVLSSLDTMKSVPCMHRWTMGSWSEDWEYARPPYVTAKMAASMYLARTQREIQAAGQPETRKAVDDSVLVARSAVILRPSSSFSALKQHLRTVKLAATARSRKLVEKARGSACQVSKRCMSSCGAVYESLQPLNDH